MTCSHAPPPVRTKEYGHERYSSAANNHSFPRSRVGAINEAMMRQKIEYIHYNPVKRGLVDEQVQWIYSSAANYAGLLGLLDVEQNR